MVTAGSGSGRECFGGELSMVSLVSLLAVIDAAVVGAGIRKEKQEGTSSNIVMECSLKHGCCALPLWTLGICLAHKA